MKDVSVKLKQIDCLKDLIKLSEKYNYIKIIGIRNNYSIYVLYSGNKYF